MGAPPRFTRAKTGHPRRPPFYLLIALGSACCLLVAAVTAWTLWHQRLAAIARAETNLQTLSVAAADQLDRVIASIALAETDLLEHIAAGPSGAAAETGTFLQSKQLHAVMRDIVAATPEAYDFLVVGQDSVPLNSSHQWPPATYSLADRAYFQFARTHPQVDQFVSETVTSRQTHVPVFNIVRRLPAPDGSFTGVLLGSIRIAYLEQLFAAVPFGNAADIAVFRQDGSLLARFPPAPAGARAVDTGFVLPGTDSDTVRHRIRADGTPVLTAVRSLPGRSLLIAVSEPLSIAIAAWRADAICLVSIAALGCLASGFTVWLGIRHQRDQHSLEESAIALRLGEERVRAAAETSKQHALFSMALNNMNEALLMFDREDHLQLANAAVLRIFELAADRIHTGMPVEAFISEVANVGNVSASPAAVIDFYLQIVRAKVPATFIRKLPDGRQIAGNYAPHDNGWILTFEDMTEIRRADERIAHMAHHDALTALPNRVMFRMRTEAALASICDGGSLAMISMDLDHFKDVNDTLGHPAGDRLLSEVAARLQAVVRPSDVVARLGGDEFAILLTTADSKPAIAAVASRLVETIARPYEINQQVVFVGTSIGIATAFSDGGDPDTLMRNADLALYRAKNEGRGRFVFFEPSMEQSVVERNRVVRELHDALSFGELDLYYQPLVKVADRQICGFEALLRWHHPVRGLVSPMEFVPIAEESGFIVQIGQWALHKACLDAMGWPGALKVAVNLSPVQFRSGKLVDAVASALASSGLAPDRLELEITEGTMMQDTGATVATLQQIKALGVRIAMDDFGTGYSSLAYLQKFPFDKVKIDRTFVRDISQPTNLAIIRAVADIATTMGISTLAEGVETEEQFFRLAQERCDEVQGYLFSPPQPVGKIAAMLAWPDALAKAGPNAGATAGRPRLLESAS